MKNTFLSALFLLGGIFFGAFSFCWASTFPVEEDEQHQLSISHFPEGIQWVILQNLSLEDEENITTVCKLWHKSHKKYQTHLMAPLRFDRDHMLQDHPSRLEESSPIILQKAFDLTLKIDGFVFVPFGQNRSLKNAISLSDTDVAYSLPTLYHIAFGITKTVLSHEDMLCLKAIIPWSRMAVIKDNDLSKKSALNALLTLHKNPNLVRFSRHSLPQISKTSQQTLVLTSLELEKNKDILHPFFKAHPGQRLHLAVDKQSCSQDGIYSLFGDSLPGIRHLTLSDPNGAVRKIGERFLMDAQDLVCLDIKAFRAAAEIKDLFSLRCRALTSFNPRGFEVLMNLGKNFLCEATNLDEPSQKRLVTFYQKIEERKINGLIQLQLIPKDFTVDHYLALNPDVIKSCHITEHLRLFAITHYFRTGKREGKPYK